MDFIAPLCEFALVELYTNGNYRQFGTGDQIDPDLLKQLKNIDRDKRIIRESDLVVLNDNSISIILAGLPINEPEKLGSILDSLATSISLSESFVSSLASKNVVANQEVKQKKFLGVIGHELRTPINAIQGFSKIIAQQIQNNTIGENALRCAKE